MGTVAGAAFGGITGSVIGAVGGCVAGEKLAETTVEKVKDGTLLEAADNLKKTTIQTVNNIPDFGTSYFYFGYLNNFWKSKI